MSWDRLPLEIYVHIFRNLDFWDRKPLSLVCRRWNEAIFSRSLCKNLCLELSRGYWSLEECGIGSDEQVRIVDHGVVEASDRDYRVVYVKWCRDSSQGELLAIDRLLMELDDKCQLEGVILDAPLGQHLSNFFNTHSELLGRVRKLQVSTECLNNRLQADRCRLKMGRLETLVWREVVSGDQLQNQKPLFLLEAPNLKSAIVRFGDSDSEHGLYWHSCFLELERSINLKALKIHLDSRMWNRFFDQKLSALEHLTIFHKVHNLRERDWNVLFSNMTNLKSLQMWEVNDAVLEAINCHCPLLKVLSLENVDLTGGFLSADRIFPQLEHIRLEFGKIVSNKTLYFPILKHLEWFNVKNQERNTLSIHAPMLKTLRQAKYGQPDFTLVQGELSLEKIQLDLYASDIPDHFTRRFPQLKDLSVRISSSRPDLDIVFPNFRNMTEFVLITYNAPLQCDSMMNQMFKNCEQITSLTLCGFNPNLELSFPVFAHIFRMQKLKTLKMFGLSITGSSFPIQFPPALERFEIRYLKLMDVAFGAYVFPPDGPFHVICNKSEEFCCYFSKDCD
ncbi:uncharacterized protein LOC129751772 [Uranotaenia lowii]|uniref:uncharacterized protein LOC129751772 n=1 Tax=Uranotaenia lowii TaxID=190385 RepID=UPI00247AD2DE|nr:uncharacterized protein LOC129751772 [Uranotaenia lowii]